MRKNHRDKKRELYSEYIIKGLNRERLINALSKDGISLFNIRFSGKDKLGVRIYCKDNKKFFAKLNKLCYNKKDIRLVRNSGLMYPLIYLTKNIGLVLGVIAFIGISVFFNGYIFSVDFTGSGSVKKSEIITLLYDNGITPFTRITDTDLKTLSNNILAKTDSLTYLSVYKRGNRLIIDSALKTENPVLYGLSESLVSAYNGEIESIVVYRGTPSVKVGDTVRIGDTLISGQMQDKDKTLITGAIGRVTLLENVEFTYSIDSEYEIEDIENYILCLSRENLNGKEIVWHGVTNQDGNYKILLKIRRIICTE